MNCEYYDVGYIISDFMKHSPKGLKCYPRVVSVPCSIKGKYSLKVCLGEALRNIGVAVSCGYDTCFVVRACDGLCHLTKIMDRVETPGFDPIDV